MWVLFSLVGVGVRVGVGVGVGAVWAVWVWCVGGCVGVGGCSLSLVIRRRGVTSALSATQLVTTPQLTADQATGNVGNASMDTAAAKSMPHAGKFSSGSSASLLQYLMYIQYSISLQLLCIDIRTQDDNHQPLRTVVRRWRWLAVVVSSVSSSTGGGYDPLPTAVPAPPWTTPPPCPAVPVLPELPTISTRPRGK